MAPWHFFKRPQIENCTAACSASSPVGSRLGWPTSSRSTRTGSWCSAAPSDLASCLSRTRTRLGISFKHLRIQGHLCGILRTLRSQSGYFALSSDPKLGSNKQRLSYKINRIRFGFSTNVESNLTSRRSFLDKFWPEQPYVSSLNNF